MKTTSLLTAVAGLVLAALLVPATAFAKEVTVSGKAMCAKCALHQGDECQTVIQTKEEGKTVTYYLTDNSVAKDFHENVCKKSAQVTATGAVEEKDGKMMLTAKKIEMTK
jgi:hypothetical protein